MPLRNCSLTIVQHVVVIGAYCSDWTNAVVEPEMEFDDVSTDIALSQGQMWHFSVVCCVCLCLRAGKCVLSQLGFLLPGGGGSKLQPFKI